MLERRRCSTVPESGTPFLEDLRARRYRPSSVGQKAMADVSKFIESPRKADIALLAIASSLRLEGEAADLPDRKGDEIPGMTLFREQGNLSAVLGVLAGRGDDLGESDVVARLIERHWERGVTRLADQLLSRRNADAAAILLAALPDRPFDGTRRPVDPDSVASTLDEVIVGQQAAKNLLVPMLKLALPEEDRRLKPLMFSGPASAGKTLLSVTVSQILGLTIFEIQGNSIGTTDALIDQFKKKLEENHDKVQEVGQDGGVPVLEFPPSILFIDEAHNLKGPISQALLTATEARTLRLRTQRHVALMHNVTWILATTDPSRLPDPFRTRFTMIDLDPPTLDDVVEILRRDNARRNLQAIPTVGLQLLARASHLIPRDALLRKGTFHDYMAVERTGERASERHVQEFLRRLDIDESGLSKLDYAYLRLLSGQERPIGIDQAAAALSQPAQEILVRIEPYFLRLGLIVIGPGGRAITDAGRKVLEHDAGS